MDFQITIPRELDLVTLLIEGKGDINQLPHKVRKLIIRGGTPRYRNFDITGICTREFDLYVIDLKC